MGMHIGLVAARTTVVELRRAFEDVFPELEVVESAACATPDELWRWMDAHRVFVSAEDWCPENRGREVLAFWQDGAWAVLADATYVVPSDEERLATLSTRFPVVLSFVVETAGGTAAFACFEHGRCRRKINNDDGEVTTEGEPLPEEAGITGASYYMDESERLARALGLSSLEDGAGPSAWKDLSAISVVDRSDYTDVASGGPSPSARASDAVRPRKPWWKLW